MKCTHTTIWQFYSLSSLVGWPEKVLLEPDFLYVDALPESSKQCKALKAKGGTSTQNIKWVFNIQHINTHLMTSLDNNFGMAVMWRDMTIYIYVHSEAGS